MSKPKLTCRKIRALIKDETMASKEYHQFMKNTTGGFSVLFDEMSNDEAKHKEYLERMKLENDCKK